LFLQLFQFASNQPIKYLHLAKGMDPSSVVDPDPDPFVLDLLDPGPLIRGTDPDPDPSIIKKK
jgi:hypothetical protein